MAAVLSSSPALDDFIQQHLNKPPRAFLQISGQHLRQGNEEPVKDFDIWIDCTVNIAAGPAEAYFTDAPQMRRAVLSTVAPTISPENLQGQPSNAISVASICEELMKALPADRRLTLQKHINDCDEPLIHGVIHQCAAIARYLGTVTITPHISDLALEIALDLPSSTPSGQRKEPRVSLTRQWAVDWSLAASPRSADSGRASLSSSPNVVRRNPLNMTWRAKLPKAMLAGYVGHLQLEDPLWTDDVSIMQAIRETSGQGNNVVSSYKTGQVTFRKVELGTWGGDE